MLFGHKNAPLIYYSVFNNNLWVFVRLPPGEVVQDVLDFLGLDPSDNQEFESGRPKDGVKRPTGAITGFQRNVPMPSHISPVLGRSSYIGVNVHLGIRATPNVVKGVMNLPFLKSQKTVLSILGRLTYYDKFIEDFPVVAVVLYELSEHRIRQGRDLSRVTSLLKYWKIVLTPMLRYTDIQKPCVIIPHAN
ncbi:reverse transcriptase [Phytophthora megakarya]|uniref:Reverse transcriptase n=1 Tax=Phytophthora megakarya TaxID=4795 RepID=A0A225WCU8_9STRA|nr:reverse transcriptase [Phytophthora megakarya]